MDRSREALLEQARQLGKNIPFAAIENMDAIDDRIGGANVHYPFMVGMNSGFIEFCPDNTPPTDNELLMILWIVKPSLAPLIAAHLKDNDFAKRIRSFDYGR